MFGLGRRGPMTAPPKRRGVVRLGKIGTRELTGISSSLPAEELVLLRFPMLACVCLRIPLLAKCLHEPRVCLEEEEVIQRNAPP
jgi:hypothetical protein